MSIEDQVRGAFERATLDVPRPEDRWAEIEAAGARLRRRNRIRNRSFVATGLVAAAVAVVVGVGLRGHEPSRRVITAPAAPSTTAGPETTTTAGTAPATSAPPSTATPATTPAGAAFPYQPMWPFRSTEEAGAWQAAYRAGGQQPWHLNAGDTALNFTEGFLGYTEITKVLRTSMTSNGTHVTVGYPTTQGRTSTAAVIHLVRYGTGVDAPWEVVGTDDTSDLALTAPKYGSVVGASFTAGGTITGVDENIKVQVRQVSSEASVGGACCVPAGGQHTAWSTTVQLQGATDEVLTVAASTGGHFQGVERFTVTAVRLR